MSDDLVRWLSGCLDAIEETARAASDGPWSTPGPDTPAEWTVFSDELEWEIATTTHYPAERAHSYWPKLRVPVDRINANSNAAHIALNDPRAVLARVEAERAIVTEYVEQVTYHGDPEGKTAALAAVRLLAYGHRRDHPGYDPAWAPGV